MTILPTILAFLATGFCAGLIVSIQLYPTMEVKRMFRAFKREGYLTGDWKHFGEVVDHNIRVIVKPNCETLYSTTFIKPSDTAYSLLIPPYPEYFSIAFLDTNTDVLGYITNKDILPEETIRFIINRTNHLKPNNENTIIVDSDLCWVIARFGIPGNGDLTSVHTMQNNLILKKI